MTFGEAASRGNLSVMKRTARLAALSLAAALLSFAPAEGLAQKGKKKKGKKGDTEQVDGKKKGGKDDLKTVSEFTKDFRIEEGLFNLYQDTVKGSMYLHVPSAAMDNEYIYFSQVEDGVVSSGFFRGSYRGSKVVTFHRHFGQLEVHAENTNFHVDPANALSKAADANLNTPILASVKIEAEDSTGLVISADALFLSENLQMIKPPSRPGRKSALGKLSKSKSKVVDVANYPKNTELSVDYVYDNGSPSVSGPEFEDGRYVTVGYRHALLPMPKDGFAPRADDPRIGFFTTEVDDLTGVSAAPWRDMIHRWRLEKKDPSAACRNPSSRSPGGLKTRPLKNSAPSSRRASKSGTRPSSPSDSRTPWWSRSSLTTPIGTQAMSVTTCCVGRPPLHPRSRGTAPAS